MSILKCLQNNPTVNNDLKIEGLSVANFGLALSLTWIAFTDSNKSKIVRMHVYRYVMEC